MTTDFRGNGYSKNRLICDCAGESTHAITTLLSNSLLSLHRIEAYRKHCMSREKSLQIVDL